MEMQTPTELNYEPPTPLRQDDFFSDDASPGSPATTLVRPSELSLAGKHMAPPTVMAEDTSLGCGESFSQEPDLSEEPRRPSEVPEESSGSGFKEVETKMSEEKLRSHMRELTMEEGSEDEDAIKVKVTREEKKMSSITGLQEESSSLSKESSSSFQKERRWLCSSYYLQSKLALPPFWHAWGPSATSYSFHYVD